MTRYGIDERNLARLNPILALNRLSAEMTGWQKIIQIDGQGIIELTCEAGKRLAPHGIDADVIFALTTAYHRQGCPDDYTITVNVSQLCDLAGLSRGKDKYARIQESIQRLKVVQFTSRNCWGRPAKGGWQWSSLSFGVIDSIREADEIDEIEHFGRYAAKTVLRIRLNEDLVASIRNDHTRFIDMAFYALLSQPLTRLLYRLLEEQRQLSSQPSCYQVALIAWGDHLGFREVDSTRPELAPSVPATRVIRADRIQRALEPAHQELIAQGYLESVTKTNRGKNQVLHYIFKNPVQVEKEDAPINLEIVELLTSRYVTQGRAENFSRIIAIADVRHAVGVYESIIKYKSVRSKGGLMADILTNPSKYETRTISISTVNKTEDKSMQLAKTENNESYNATEEQARMLRRILKKTALAEDISVQLIDRFMDKKLSLMELMELSQLSGNDLKTKVSLLLQRVAEA